MKKKLLTLMFVFSVLLVSATFANADVNASSVVDANKASAKFLKNEAIYLNKKCQLVGNACDNAIQNAESTLKLSYTICDNKGWGSQDCTSAVTRADSAVNNAATECGAAEPKAPNVAQHILKPLNKTFGNMLKNPFG